MHILFSSIENPNKPLIRPVSPEEFNVKISESSDMILKVLGNFVIPAVSIGFLISIIVYVTGGILHSDKVRKAGAGGIGASMLGYFIYMISPYLMGLLYGITQVFK
ncbi:hypothetical protein [Clostridium tyrobutyricum]|uniref:hypothetical protein n=1 Tax=Clostridium tyrobutyricum TaxID=1519 RepID=UPI000E82E1AD|nr:hypothetical protein [Clostridium tyrobutyricum]HBF76638.1 hypothetical protein [Clostridiaceae bacterium]